MIILPFTFSHHPLMIYGLFALSKKSGRKSSEGPIQVLVVGLVDDCEGYVLTPSIPSLHVFQIPSTNLSFKY
ncbi:hypothetical protein VNO80_08910 [Phaseolus coccineus]|uniref:Uncharacterized protein n=1 Tax=Phaseolus coccineus TaxID=3886 RepID=A0AAN9NAG3_PHACN